MLEDLNGLNLWMFLLAGVFGFMLCYFERRIWKYLVVVQVLVCILYLFKLSEPLGGDVGPPVTISRFRFSILFSMSFFLILPVLGWLFHMEGSDRAEFRRRTR